MASPEDIAITARAVNTVLVVDGECSVGIATLAWENLTTTYDYSAAEGLDNISVAGIDFFSGE